MFNPPCVLTNRVSIPDLWTGQGSTRCETNGPHDPLDCCVTSRSVARPSAELCDPSATSGTLSFVEGQSDETLYEMGDGFSLPPADHGKQAWLFLAAAFVVEALTWGFPFAFGVFHDYYVTHALFAGSSQIPVIGTWALLSSGAASPPSQ
ncbi:hypothetical protein HIM_10231 [Hirsutella minnesotensis 3608]|uniref:Major facilitator superfamily (MFS) profile domain-containing protein n=1 Tax=Hirsutella minnesotensis 3608 TaxID=1043627 RepID=A0A0F7ZXA6_9HYPO|nr:hypothetical protein HIM_10231 [Hirsutella minnesotensis 3608]